ncbi:hypothetical protein [Mycobacteroides chelonae]|uniref:hypothetical protein n=1 Tax=Mycobacteroides chelonae TaxID=1774 RepID=UPI0008A889DA|nr:hypothetical protein [Mycobacteroides chelonae]OLT92924.1 hypothetical protein BKG59_05695 [Mycobacteroides chelonae]
MSEHIEWGCPKGELTVWDLLDAYESLIEQGASVVSPLHIMKEYSAAGESVIVFKASHRADGTVCADE